MTRGRRPARRPPLPPPVCFALHFIIADLVGKRPPPPCFLGAPRRERGDLARGVVGVGHGWGYSIHAARPRAALGALRAAPIAAGVPWEGGLHWQQLQRVAAQLGVRCANRRVVCSCSHHARGFLGGGARFLAGGARFLGGGARFFGGWGRLLGGGWSLLGGGRRLLGGCGSLLGGGWRRVCTGGGRGLGRGGGGRSLGREGAGRGLGRGGGG